MGNWIFVAGSRSIPSAEEALKRRLKLRYWPLGRNTKSAQRLSPGDQVVFYLAGKGNRTFVGRAELASLPRPIQEITSSSGAEQGDWSLAVQLTRADLWPKAVPVEPLVPRLSFIGVKEQWSSRFAIGLISINDRDFELICEAATEANS